jgi:adenosine deaminase
MDYRSLPKIELHLHLDCSLSYKVVHQIDPSITEEQYKESFIAPPKCTDLVDYLKRAVKGFELMQTKEQLRLVTLDVLEQLDADNVVYAEVRFAPLLHIAKGLTPKEVVGAVNDAVEEGKKTYKVIAKLLLCTMRHYSEEQSFQTVKLVEQFKDTNVVGFDIAGDEAGFPIDAHKKAFQFAKANGIHCTSHAGEAKGAESVTETLDNFGPTRIGHGVRSAEKESVLQLLLDRDIHLELCPTSNVQTNIFPSVKEHAIDKIYKKGVSLSVNCDCRTITPVTLTSEYASLEDAFGWNSTHFLRCNLEAIRHCFADEATKEKLRAIVQKAY